MYARLQIPCAPLYLFLNCEKQLTLNRWRWKSNW